MPSTDVLDVRIDSLEQDVRDMRADLKEVLGELRNSTRSIDETFKKLVALEANSQADRQSMSRAFSSIDSLEKTVSELKVEQARESTRMKIIIGIAGALLPALGFIAEHYVKFP